MATKAGGKRKTAELARGAAVALAGGTKPPTEFRIFKFGTIRTTKGEFVFDKKAAKSVMDAWRDYGNDLCLDYEHRAVEKGRAGDGKAAGWFKLEVRGDGLYAVGIKWTPQAQEQISNREWRYFSPAFDYDHETHRVLELINVALTNIPATKDLPALVAANRDKNMALKKKKATKATKKSEKLAVKTKKKVTETETVDDGDETTAKKMDEESTDDAEDDEEDADEAEDDEADDDEEADDEADDDEEDSDGDDDADSDADPDDDDSGAPPPKKAPPAKSKKAAKTAKAKCDTSGRITRADRALLSAAKKLAGTDDSEEALGALSTIGTLSERLDASERRLAKMDAQARNGEIRALVDDAMKCGKITKAEKDDYVQIGKKQGRKFLKGMLSRMPKKLRMEGDVDREVDTKTLSADAELPLEARKIQKKLGVDFKAMIKDGTFMPLDRFVNPQDEDFLN